MKELFLKGFVISASAILTTYLLISISKESYKNYILESKLIDAQIRAQETRRMVHEIHETHKKCPSELSKLRRILWFKLKDAKMDSW